MDSCLEVTTRWHGAMLSLKHFNNPSSLRIGRNRNADMVVEDERVPEGTFELIRRDAKKFLICNAPWLKLRYNGQPIEGKNIELGKNDVVNVQIGNIDLTLRQIVGEKTVAPPLFENFDTSYAVLLILLLLMQAAFIFQVRSMPAVTKDDLLKNPEAFREVMVKIHKREKKRVVEASSAGGAAPEPEGLIGEKDKPKEDKLPAKQGVKMEKENTPARSQNAALNMLKKLGLRNAGSVLGDGGLGVGANKGLLGLRGSAVGIAGGNGGLGTKGTGRGGGGKTLGAGGLGSGSGLGFGGTGDVDLGGKGKGRTRIIPGDIFYEGGLTREEIQRVVERFMSQIKYCYEREIQSKPDLEGKLTANWVIAPDGRVRISTLGDSTLGNSNVEQCVLKVVNRMVFPEPRGGGIVKVTFPFVFSTAGV